MENFLDTIKSSKNLNEYEEILRRTYEAQMAKDKTIAEEYDPYKLKNMMISGYWDKGFTRDLKSNFIELIT